MVTLNPETDLQKVADLFAKHGLDYTENSGCIAARHKDELLGFCLYDIDAEAVTIRYIYPENDIPLADGILRSTLHLAARRGLTKAFYSDKAPEQLFERLGFVADKSKKALNIDKLFEACGGCKA